MGKALLARVLYAVLILIPTGSICQEVILLRSAGTLESDEILMWESLFLTPLTGKYDFQENKFTDLEGDNLNFTSYTMLGYGISNNLELLFQLPFRRNVSTRGDRKKSSVGYGDISLQARFLLHDGSSKLPAVNIGAMVRFPTGNNQLQPPLGNGTSDFGLSTVITKKIGFFTYHAKIGYIFAGRTSDEINIGNKFLYMLKGDFIVTRRKTSFMKELALMIGLSGSFKFDDVDLHLGSLNNSHQYRPLNIVPMIRWVPKKKFFVRPKVVIPIKALARGGKIYSAQYVLDLKYSF